MNYVRIWKLHLALRCMIRNNGFPHVLYRLWLIGMAASHLEVITRRCRTQITWLWPCDMKSNEGNSSGVIVWYIKISVLYMYIFYMFILLSSHYLFVISNDHVHGIRDQMMLLQVVLVRLSYGAGIAWEFYITQLLDIIIEFIIMVVGLLLI